VINTSLHCRHPYYLPLKLPAKKCRITTSKGLRGDARFWCSNDHSDRESGLATAVNSHMNVIMVCRQIAGLIFLNIHTSFNHHYYNRDHIFVLEYESTLNLYVSQNLFLFGWSPWLHMYVGLVKITQKLTF
jgi:hypothetical protein